MSEPDYKAEPSYDLRDAIKLPLLFHAGGMWDDDRRAEWLRITGTSEATTKVMCDHLRSALAIVSEGDPDLLAAARLVLADLHHRIEAAAGTAVPVFEGIAALAAAVAKADLQQQGRTP